MCVCVCVRGGGGGKGGKGGWRAYVKNRDQIINFGMIRHGSSESTRAECKTYGLTKTGRLSILGVTFASAEGASL